MNLFLPTIILRHRRENLKKCSLRGLEQRPDLQFYTYPKDPLPSLDSYILLTLEAPLLEKEDKEKGLFLIDGTWRHSEVMLSQVKKYNIFQMRSLPKELQTAYPRRQEDCLDPGRGLASIEALYAAYVMMGKDPTGLLDLYYWKNAFLEKNRSFFQNH
jgi:pre-rRNA-processing protein TSR3